MSIGECQQSYYINNIQGTFKLVYHSIEEFRSSGPLFLGNSARYRKRTRLPRLRPWLNEKCEWHRSPGSVAPQVKGVWIAYKQLDNMIPISDGDATATPGQEVQTTPPRIPSTPLLMSPPTPPRIAQTTPPQAEVVEPKVQIRACSPSPRPKQRRRSLPSPARRGLNAALDGRTRMCPPGFERLPNAEGSRYAVEMTAIEERGRLQTGRMNIPPESFSRADSIPPGHTMCIHVLSSANNAFQIAINEENNFLSEGDRCVLKEDVHYCLHNKSDVVDVCLHVTIIRS